MTGARSTVASCANAQVEHADRKAMARTLVFMEFSLGGVDAWMGGLAVCRRIHRYRWIKQTGIAITAAGAETLRWAGRCGLG
ncbi:hypothetical protein GCM10027400_27440 [Pseudoxanthomonas daejeonensis]|jgi:hypothetical protein